MKRRNLVIFLILVLVGAGLGWGIASANLGALDERGPAGDVCRNQGQAVSGWPRCTRNPARNARRSAAERDDWEMQFRARCASCHGLDGRTPSEIGRGMYPRASDLGSAPAQEWSDIEPFWIIKNGVHLTGMPSFGKVLSDEEIWPLVD